MTLYELVNSTTIQGNIEIRVFDQDNTEIESRVFRDQDDFNPKYRDCDDIEDCDILFIYCHKSPDGTPWLTIEVESAIIPLF